MAECHECGDDCKRRTRCKRCDQLVCRWCYHHIHNAHLQDWLIKSQKKDKSKKESRL